LASRTRRFIFFGVAILVGFMVGVIYGWEINPQQTAGSMPHTLRIDYKTDQVLMEAELYQAEGDISLALARLAPLLGDVSPITLMNETIAYAERHYYAQEDIQKMRDLASAILVILPLAE